MPVTLFDAFTRYQVYLEGYKSGLERSLDPILTGIRDDVRRAMSAYDVSAMNELTRRQLNELISTIQGLQRGRGDAYRATMLAELQAFAEADAALNVRIMEHVEGKTAEEAFQLKDGLPLLGLAGVVPNRQGRKRLWAMVSSSPDPASGQTPPELVNTYLRSLSARTKQIIVRGYANGWTPAETARAINGTAGRRYRDGFLATARRQGASMIHTAVQHVSSLVQAGVASLFYKYYEWVSVLDTRTTKICQFRDGVVYRYRKGPLPPAHYNCRSRAVPIKRGATYQNIPGNFHGWILSQPALVQNDVVGVRAGQGLRSGRVTAQTLGRFRSRQRLTLDQFTAKFALITTT